MYQSNLVYRWVREYLHIYVYILLITDCETALWLTATVRVLLYTESVFGQKRFAGHGGQSDRTIHISLRHKDIRVEVHSSYLHGAGRIFEGKAG